MLRLMAHRMRPETGARTGSRARVGAFLLAVSALLLLPAAVAAQEPHPELAPLERLIGGRWYLGDSYNVFEWGVGGQSVRMASYAVLPEGDQLIAEGAFVYHPGRQMITGFAVAVGMGIDYFDYEIQVRGDTLDMALEAFGPQAMEGPIRETWVFTDDDHYVWTLLQGAGDGWAQIMGATYERRDGGR